MTPESYPTAMRDGLEVKLELLVHFPVRSIHASPRQQIQQCQQRHEAMVQGGLVFSSPSGTLHALHSPTTACPARPDVPECAQHPPWGPRGALQGEYGAALCWMQPLPGGSGGFQMAPTAPAHSTAEPISDAGGAFGEMYLRHSKMQLGTGEEKKVWEVALQAVWSGMKRCCRCSPEAPGGVLASRDINTWD